MTATLTKKFSIGIIASMFIALFMMFATPVVSHASPNSSDYGDIGSVNMTISNSGSLQIDGNQGFTAGGTAGAWNTLLGKYKKFIVGISGIGAISMIAFFIMQFMKLGASAGNPSLRSQALVGVLWTGLAAAGLGAVTLIVGFFYHSVS